MSFTENGNGLSAADVAAVMGNNGNSGFGWVFRLSLFLEVRT